MSTNQTSWLGCCVLCVSVFFVASGENRNTIAPSAAAGLTLITPNGGETFSLNDSLTIRWEMSDSVDALMSQLVFSLSLDSGITFNYMGDIRRSSPFWKARSIRFSLRDSLWDEQTVVWKPILPSSGCIIYINQYNSTSIYDQSDNPFRISAPAHANHFPPVTRTATGSVHHNVAYDIQGRKLKMSGARMQNTPLLKSRGVFIEQGQLRLMAR